MFGMFARDRVLRPAGVQKTKQNGATSVFEDSRVSQERHLARQEAVHLLTSCVAPYHTCLLILTSTNNGSWHRVHLLHGGIGKIPGGLLTIQKVKKEVSQVLSERSDPFLAVFGNNLQK